MKRREFIALLVGTAIVRPLGTSAQPITKPVVGFLNSASADTYADEVAAFRHGLSDQGFIDGQNITIEYHWAAGQYNRLSEMAADLVHREVAVIVANTPAITFQLCFSAPLIRLKRVLWRASIAPAAI